MAHWEERQLRRTLYIQRNGTKGNYTYRLNGFMSVTTPDGQTYMEPMPSLTYVSLASHGLTFADVQFIEEPGSCRDDMLSLTRTSSRGSVRITSDDVNV